MGLGKIASEYHKAENESVCQIAHQNHTQLLVLVPIRILERDCIKSLQLIVKSDDRCVN